MYPERIFDVLEEIWENLPGDAQETDPTVVKIATSYAFNYYIGHTLDDFSPFDVIEDYKKWRMICEIKKNAIKICDINCVDLNDLQYWMTRNIRLRRYPAYIEDMIRLNIEFNILFDYLKNSK